MSYQKLRGDGDGCGYNGSNQQSEYDDNDVSNAEDTEFYYNH